MAVRSLLVTSLPPSVSLHDIGPPVPLGETKDRKMSPEICSLRNLSSLHLLCFRQKLHHELLCTFLPLMSKSSYVIRQPLLGLPLLLLNAIPGSSGGWLPSYQKFSYDIGQDWMRLGWITVQSARLCPVPRVWQWRWIMFSAGLGVGHPCLGSGLVWPLSPRVKPEVPLTSLMKTNDPLTCGKPSRVICLKCKLLILSSNNQHTMMNGWTKFMVSLWTLLLKLTII